MQNWDSASALLCYPMHDEERDIPRMHAWGLERHSHFVTVQRQREKSGRRSREAAAQAKGAERKRKKKKSKAKETSIVRPPPPLSFVRERTRAFCVVPMCVYPAYTDHRSQRLLSERNLWFTDFNRSRKTCEKREPCDQLPFFSRILVASLSILCHVSRTPLLKKEPLP